jgi:hypothetical protein
LQCLIRVRRVREQLGMEPAASSAVADDASDSEREAAPAPSDEALTDAELERKAAEATFLEGGVARIVFTHAIAALPTLVDFELQLADACLRARDPVTGSLLVPKLLAAIVEDVRHRFAKVSNFPLAL